MPKYCFCFCSLFSCVDVCYLMLCNSLVFSSGLNRGGPSLPISLTPFLLCNIHDNCIYQCLSFAGNFELQVWGATKICDYFFVYGCRNLANVDSPVCFTMMKIGKTAKHTDSYLCQSLLLIHSWPKRHGQLECGRPLWTPSSALK